MPKDRAGLPGWPFHCILKNLAIFEIHWPWKNRIGHVMKFGHFFSFHTAMKFSINILSFLHFSEGLHVSVTATPWYFNLVFFEVCSNDLTLAASWFCTNVSSNDSLMDTIGSCYTCIWGLLCLVVWLYNVLVEAFCILPQYACFCSATM